MAGELDLTAARRLQLAAEAGGVLGLLLRADEDSAAPTAALTRWRIGAGTAWPPSSPMPRWMPASNSSAATADSG